MKFISKNTILIILSILISWANVHAAQGTDMKFDHPFNTASYNCSITQDKDGFLWVGTTGGLVRYDGQDVKVYTARPGSLSTNLVPSALEDRDGLLWIPSLGGGLNCFDRNTDTFIWYKNDLDNPNSINSNHFNWAPKTVAEDNDGLLWVGTQGGLNKYDKKTDIFTRYQHEPGNPNSLSDNNIWSVCIDREGFIWIGTQKGGLNKFDKKTNTFTRYRHDPDNPDTLSADWVYAITEDMDGYLWIGTKGGGLDQFDKNTRKFTHYRHDPDDPDTLANDEVYSVMEDKQGDLWIGHPYSISVGLEKFDKKTRKFIHYRHDPENPDSLSGDIIMSCFEDRAGILWVIENTGPVEKYDRQSRRFHLYRNDPKDNRSLSTNAIVTITEDSKNQIWMGSQNGFLKYNRTTDDFTVYKHDPDNPEGLSDNYAFSVFEDNSGTFWVGTNDGMLGIFDRETEAFVKRYKNEYAREVARNLMEDKNNPDILWFGTEAGGIFKFDKRAEMFRHYEHDPDDPDTLGINSAWMLFQDSDGVLWIGTSGGGLDRFDSNTETFKHHKNDPDNPESISGNVVNDCYTDSSGRFWISTDDGGLNKFDKHSGTFKHYTKDHGFPSNAVRGILEDKEGFLWLGSDSGLLKFDPEKETVVKIYTEKDGLQGNKFSYYTTSALKTRDGEMWFAGLRGVNSFYPEKIKDNPYIPPVVLTSFRQGDEEPDFGMAIERVREMNLTWQKNFFEFEFASLNYTLPEKNRHAYMLEGFDTKWNHIGIRRYGKYTNLPGGTYTLRLRGSNNDGVWNEKGVAIRITVPSPPWKRWWAYSLYVIMLAGIVFGYVRHRTKAQAEELERQRKELDQERLAAERLRRIDKMKDEFLANTSHELRTPLNGIIGIAESLADGAVGPVTSEQSRNLAMISSSGRRLTNLVNDILDFSKLKTHDLDIRSKPMDIRSITEIVMALSRPLIGQKSVTLENHIPDSLPLAHADEDRLQQILINLIGNAIKFTHEGQVTVSAAHKDLQNKDLRGFENLGGLNEFIRVSVSDTGIGIPEEEQERIFKSFEQADGSADREYGGTGLGLAVTKKLVELHGGAIEVESSPDRGAIFSFTLPVAQDQTVEDVPEIIEQRIASEASVQDESFHDDEAKPETGDQQTVLVVDDEIVNIQVLKNHLSAQNYRVLTAQSGLQALEILQHEEPDIVILDLMMPRMNGYEVCRKIRETKDPSSMPIVMLTAKNRGSDLIQGFDCGANDYLVKPFNKGELLARAKAHLELKAYHGKLSASEKKYRSLHERALEGIFQTTPDGRVLSVNPALVRIMGYDSEEDLISSVMNLGEEVYASRQDREEFIRLIRENGQVEGFETKFHRKDGTTIWVSLYSRSVHDAEGKLLHFEGLLVDITERLEKEKAEREREVIRAVNEKIMDSINYAQRIQASVLPNMEEMRTYLPDSFFLWEPRDVVGGDIYFAERFDDGILIAVIDCTGHGVPGAFMSMIASSAMRRITINKGCHDPAEILKQMNIIVKTSLQQDKEYAVSDDGMDMAVCFLKYETSEVSKTSEVSTLIFAGAKLPLFHVSDGEVNMIKGDRQSIGYKRSDLTFDFTNHTVSAEKGVSFYMSTDGFWDQLGGEKPFSFGKKRFRDLLGQFEDSPFEKQQEMLVQAFKEHKGEWDRLDDVTVVGFKV